MRGYLHKLNEIELSLKLFKRYVINTHANTPQLKKERRFTSTTLVALEERQIITQRSKIITNLASFVNTIRCALFPPRPRLKVSL